MAFAFYLSVHSARAVHAVKISNHWALILLEERYFAHWLLFSFTLKLRSEREKFFFSYIYSNVVDMLLRVRNARYDLSFSWTHSFSLDCWEEQCTGRKLLITLRAATVISEEATLNQEPWMYGGLQTRLHVRSTWKTTCFKPVEKLHRGLLYYATKTIRLGHFVSHTKLHGWRTIPPFHCEYKIKFKQHLHQLQAKKQEILIS
jgi:hypothetical protein